MKNTNRIFKLLQNIPKNITYNSRYNINNVRQINSTLYYKPLQNFCINKNPNNTNDNNINEKQSYNNFDLDEDTPIIQSKYSIRSQGQLKENKRQKLTLDEENPNEYNENIVKITDENREYYLNQNIFPQQSPDTEQINLDEELKYREEFLKEMQIRAKNDPFYNQDYVVNTSKYLDDDEVVVDVENFDTKEYLKYIFNPKNKIQDKDDFPRQFLYITIAFILNVFMIEVVYRGIIFRDLLNESEGESMPEGKMVKQNIEGQDIYVNLDDQTFNFTQLEISVDNLSNRIKQIKTQLKV